MSASRIALLLLLGGCAAEAEPQYLQEPKPFRTEVHVWGNFDPAIELLHMVGFELVQASAPEHAQVVIYPGGDRCDDFVAYASPCGGVWLCGHDVSPAVLAHEIGHTLGVQHVPESEGLAVMNSHVTATGMTELDAEAFVHRRIEGSVFDPGCEKRN